MDHNMRLVDVVNTEAVQDDAGPEKMATEDETPIVEMKAIPFDAPQNVEHHVPIGKMAGGSYRVDAYGCHRLYGAKNNETIKHISKLFDIDAMLILRTNESRIDGLELTSKLQRGTILALPIRKNEEVVALPPVSRNAVKQKRQPNQKATTTPQPSTKRKRTAVAPTVPPRETLARTSKQNALLKKQKAKKEKSTKKPHVKATTERSSSGSLSSAIIPVVKSREMVLTEILNRLNKDKANNAAPVMEEVSSDDEEPLSQLEHIQLASLALLQKMKSILNGLAPDDAFGSEFVEEEKYNMQIFRPDSKAERIKCAIQYQWDQSNAKPKSKKPRKPEVANDFFINPDQFKDPNMLWIADLDWENIVNFYLLCEKNKTPFPFETVEVRKIDDSDARVKLRGQNGLFAKHGVQMEEGTVIGPYVALAQFSDEQQRVVGSIADFLESERYSYEFPAIDFSTLEEFSKMDVTDYPKLFGNGHAAGNIIRAANDFRFDPFGKRRGCTEDGRTNCAFVECYHKGWPYAFVVTTSTIKGGQELLLDYSETYWDASVCNETLVQFRTECTNDDCGLQRIHHNLGQLQQ
eukprot:m.138422 g.138422  ORF g.138422 m.138422 type:complete len:578 (-) comp29993_c0_seq3:339-2072(-)